MRRVGNNHFVGIGRVHEEVVDTLFFHEAGGELEIAFPVLNAVIPGLKCALYFPAHVQVGEHCFQDVRNSHLLEDAAAHLAGEEPELRNQLGRVAGEAQVAATL